MFMYNCKLSSWNVYRIFSRLDIFHARSSKMLQLLVFSLFEGALGALGKKIWDWDAPVRLEESLDYDFNDSSLAVLTIPLLRNESGRCVFSLFDVPQGANVRFSRIHLYFNVTVDLEGCSHAEVIPFDFVQLNLTFSKGFITMINAPVDPEEVRFAMKVNVSNKQWVADNLIDAYGNTAIDVSIKSPYLYSLEADDFDIFPPRSLII